MSQYRWLLLTAVPLFLLTLLLATSVPASSQTGSQQRIKRAYAKLMFASETTTVQNTVTTNQHRHTATNLAAACRSNRLTFTINDFTEGSIAGNSAPVSEVLSPATDPQLYVMSTNGTYSVGNQSIQSAFVETHFVRHTGAESLQGFPISALAVDQPWAENYTSYRVTASYQGKTTSYRAVLLEGGGQAAFLDPFITNGNLQGIDDQNVYPFALLRYGTYRDAPGVSDWLRDRQMTAPDCRSGEACCDTTSMQCGILPFDLTKELANPTMEEQQSIPKPRSDNGNPDNLGGDYVACTDYDGTFDGSGPYWQAPFLDTQQHDSGNHELYDEYGASCTFDDRLYNGGHTWPCWST